MPKFFVGGVAVPGQRRYNIGAEATKWPQKSIYITHKL